VFPIFSPVDARCCNFKPVAVRCCYLFLLEISLLFWGYSCDILVVSSERWVIKMNELLVKQLTNIINNFDKGYLNYQEVTQEVIDAFFQFTRAKNEIESK
jgi:hypothetical protein